jgi:hypothetical protein
MRTLLLSLLIALPGAALAQGPDVAVVNLVAGEVSFVPLVGAPGKVQPFMKVRDGDRFNIAPGAQLRLVFFDGGRQERWLGPASFRAGRTEAEPIAGAPGEITRLPAGVAPRLSQIPDLVQHARLGGTQLRSIPRAPQAGGTASTLAEARANYGQMRKDMAGDDITPELYLYAVLQEHQLHDEMKQVAGEMLRRQPQNDQARLLLEHAERRGAR